MKITAIGSLISAGGALFATGALAASALQSGTIKTERLVLRDPKTGAEFVLRPDGNGLMIEKSSGKGFCKVEFDAETTRLSIGSGMKKAEVSITSSKDDAILSLGSEAVIVASPSDAWLGLGGKDSPRQIRLHASQFPSISISRTDVDKKYKADGKGSVGITLDGKGAGRLHGTDQEHP